jgi:hypothetical protein
MTDPIRIARRLNRSTKHVDRNVRALLLRLLDQNQFAYADMPEGVGKVAYRRGLTDRATDWAKLTEFGAKVAQLVRPKPWIAMGSKTWLEPDGTTFLVPSLIARPHRLIVAEEGPGRFEQETAWVLDVGGHRLPELVAETLTAAELTKAKTFIGESARVTRQRTKTVDEDHYP